MSLIQGCGASTEKKEEFFRVLFSVWVAEMSSLYSFKNMRMPVRLLDITAGCGVNRVDKQVIPGSPVIMLEEALIGELNFRADFVDKNPTSIHELEDHVAGMGLANKVACWNKDNSTFLAEFMQSPGKYLPGIRKPESIYGLLVVDPNGPSEQSGMPIIWTLIDFLKRHKYLEIALFYQDRGHKRARGVKTKALRRCSPRLDEIIELLPRKTWFVTRLFSKERWDAVVVIGTDYLRFRSPLLGAEFFETSSEDIMKVLRG